MLGVGSRQLRLLSTAKARPAQLPEVSMLQQMQTRLAASFDDGTPEGQSTSDDFMRLSMLVCALLSKQQHERTVRLQDRYRLYDPSVMRQRRPPPSRHSASSLCASLHETLLRGGFHLLSYEDELRTLEGHFGGEGMWHAMPVAHASSGLDASLVSRAHGGFDPYTIEEASGRATARPSFARTILVYRRGFGEVQTTGYFVADKVEALLLRSWRRLVDRNVERAMRQVSATTVSRAKRARVRVRVLCLRGGGRSCALATA